MTVETQRTALLVVDMQYDFIDGSRRCSPLTHSCRPGSKHSGPCGSPAYPRWRVGRGDSDAGASRCLTQDAHPPDHISFASVHGAQPLEEREVPHPREPSVRLRQCLWPDHCVRGTHGAALHADVQASLKAAEDAGTYVHYLCKGTDADVDCYSAFASAAYASFTPLAAELFRRDIRTAVVCGLATDYCVKCTAIDAAKLGFRTLLVDDAVAGVAPDTTAEARRLMAAYGVECVRASELDAALRA